MRFPALRGLIDRRILLNFRFDAGVVRDSLPHPFRPKLLNGFAMGGVCLTRMKELRPRGIPALLGQKLETAVFRFAVQWQQDGELQEGVYVTRHFISTKLNLYGRGKLIQDAHSRGRFTVEEKHPFYTVAMQSDDFRVTALVSGAASDRLPRHSVFRDADHAAEFFRAPRSYWATRSPGVFAGVELSSAGWRVMPFEAREVDSSLLRDFPRGSAEFDCALLMRRTDHEWRELEPICVEQEQLQEAA